METKKTPELKPWVTPELVSRANDWCCSPFKECLPSSIGEYVCERCKDEWWNTMRKLHEIPCSGLSIRVRLD